MSAAKKRTRKDYIDEAAKARSDLNMFYAVMALAEGSLFSTPYHAAESQIVKICKRESAKCLVRMDRAIAKAISYGGGR